MSTFKTLIYSLLIILIIHFFLKNILLQYEISADIEKFEKYNIGNNNTSECTKPANINSLNNMKDDLLNFINSDHADIYDIKNHDGINDMGNDPSFDTNNSSDFDSNLTNLDKFFENTQLCDESVTVDDNKSQTNETKSCISNNWEYDNENIMNGGEISNGLQGFDSLNNSWALCDNQESIKCVSADRPVVHKDLLNSNPTF